MVSADEALLACIPTFLLQGRKGIDLYHFEKENLKKNKWLSAILKSGLPRYFWDIQNMTHISG